MRNCKERTDLIKATSTVLFCHLSGLSEMTTIKKKTMLKIQCGSFAISYKLTLEKRVNEGKEFISTTPSSTQHTFSDSVSMNVPTQSLQELHAHKTQEHTYRSLPLVFCSYLTEYGQTWNSLSVHSHSSLVNRPRNTLPRLGFSWRISSNSSMVNHTHL